MKMEPGKIKKMKIIKPNPELIVLTKEILEQNHMILQANLDLLKLLAHPFSVFDKKAMES